MSEVSLELAKRITQEVNDKYESGEFVESISAVSRDLVRFWFEEEFTQNREINFHIGQKQALLNIIYCYEIKQIKSVQELYEYFYKSGGLKTLDKLENNDIIKFCFKMATGTGKTWVMNAVIVWQYLNHLYTHNSNIRFCDNFLLIAPGLIVYERLLDSYKGRVGESGERDYRSGDIMRNIELFVPEFYRRDIERFLASSVFSKDEGLHFRDSEQIIIANWHFFKDNAEEEYVPTNSTLFDALENTPQVIKSIFPLTPGTDSKHELNVLDKRFLQGSELKILCECKNLCVINDEAHHLGDDKEQKKWARLMDILHDNITNNGGIFMQCDFSATPFTQKIKGKNTAKFYFPHIIIDFDISNAVKNALVKNISLDRRSQIGSLKELDYKAIRDENNNIIELSKGQKIMIEAGIRKLEILEEAFLKIDDSKYPKMMIVCEEKSVIALVEEFLESRGYDEEMFLSITSDTKGEIGKDEYERIKARLFNIDKHKKPKFIISVLMLREGFDVSNVCVIVALRANTSNILVEQTIGRGLRLMWRGEEYIQMRKENLSLLSKGLQPKSYIDNLFLIEHPAFSQFYDDMINNNIIFSQDEDFDSKDVLGDIVQVQLCEDFKDYDLSWIRTYKDSKGISDINIDITKFKPYPKPLKELKKWLHKGEHFVSQDIRTSTEFGEYIISVDIFNAKAYNEYLSRMCENISGKVQKAQNNIGVFLQIEQDKILNALDCYIKNKLFDCEFLPLKDENWRVLMLEPITTHIIKEFLHFIFSLETLNKERIAIEKIPFSSINSFNYRQKFLLSGTKSIYTFTPYPTNKGGLEEKFINFIQTQSSVIAFIKIMESKHTFAYIPYIRTDGHLGKYFPDFLLKVDNEIYIVEIKAQKDMEDLNVKAKEKAALEYIADINANIDSTYHYIIVGENNMHSIIERKGSFIDLARQCELKY